MQAYRALALALRPPLRHGLSWAVDGAERIPAEGPVLLAANHVSFFDPLVLAYLADRRGRQVRFLAMAELFRIPVLATVLAAVGQIPVERSTAKAAASLESARVALAGGACVGVFPEGAISADLNPTPGRTGTVRLAMSSAVAVVPVGIWGTQRLHRKGRRIRWRPGWPVAVSVGEPLSFASDTHPRLGTDRLMEAICAGVNRARDLYPGGALGVPPARLRTCRGPAVEAQLQGEVEAQLQGEAEAQLQREAD